MIYITGDTHIPTDIEKLSSRNFKEQKNLTKNDYVIICGDFGGVWDGSSQERHWIKWLNQKPFTTLFVDGNHENFDMLEQFPCVDFCKGKAHKISESIFHLQRGQIFEIDGKSIFTLGGASSHDKDLRKEGKNFWKAELPSKEEYEIALKNLERTSFAVDYIITHCAPQNIQDKIAPNYETNELTDFLESVSQKTNFKKWFFGHYHMDLQIEDAYFAIFDAVLKI